MTELRSVLLSVMGLYNFFNSTLLYRGEVFFCFYVMFYYISRIENCKNSRNSRTKPFYT